MEKVTIIFATNNANKAREVKTLLPKKFTLKTLADIGFAEEIEETEKTLEGNASLKSQAIFNSHSCNVFSDDTGLEVDALNGEPGVFSARYAKMQGYADGNMNFLLEKLKDISNRKARFRTIISLILNGKEYLFEGIVNGEIAMSIADNSLWHGPHYMYSTETSRYYFYN